ncbi:MAG: TonB-dependent receptor plug domain-containing protein, partial [Bacteroidales bacterium]
ILKQATLEIDEIVVTAKQTQSKQGTSSYRIGQDAIKQVQAMSLTDIMQLLPGNKITPPDLNSVNQVDIRNASATASSINSFGTSVVVDGTPMNNDANMQSSNPATGASGGKNTVNKGIDLRSIPASNVESVEVIAGVPSAKYGNITSGTILINRKAGYTPLYTSINLNPTSYQVGASKGFKLAKGNGYLNTDIDYTYSNNRPTEKASYYQRLNAGVRWTTTIDNQKNWTNTTSLSFGTGKDGLKAEKDRVTPNYSKTENSNFALTLNGRLNLLGNFSYNAGVNYSRQSSYFQNETSGPVPMIQPSESGTYFTTYSPLNFMQKTSIEGGPLNLYARADASQMLATPSLEISFLTGAEYSYSKNTGKGRVTMGDAVTQANLPGSRSALFHQLPASAYLALYHETDIKKKGENSDYLLRLGGRYDYMNNRFHLFSPRLSFSAKYYKKIRFRAAYGLSYKAPSMLNMYPGPVYFDLTNLSYYHNDPASRLAIVTTYVHQPQNTHLKPSRGETFEAGIDLESNDISIRVTAYSKNITGGITSFDRLMILEKQNYRIVSQPQGQQPQVEEIPGDITYLPRVYSQYVNNQELRTNGIEVSIEPPRIAATNTSFMITGSYIKSSDFKSLPVLRSSSINTNSQGNRYGEYRSTTYHRSVTSSNVTLIQHIPAIRLVVTFIAELNLYQKRSADNPSIYATGYYDKRGEYFLIPEQERESVQYQDLKLPEHTYEYQDPPFYPNFHLQIRKETKYGHSFSMYANNCFWYNPEYLNDVNNLRIRLNSRISFGFGISIKI